jgi:hypothetical protein
MAWLTLRDKDGRLIRCDRLRSRKPLGSVPPVDLWTTQGR